MRSLSFDNEVLRDSLWFLKISSHLDITYCSNSCPSFVTFNNVIMITSGTSIINIMIIRCKQWLLLLQIARLSRFQTLVLSYTGTFRQHL